MPAAAVKERAGAPAAVGNRNYAGVQGVSVLVKARVKVKLRKSLGYGMAGMLCDRFPGMAYWVSYFGCPYKRTFGFLLFVSVGDTCATEIIIVSCIISHGV